MRNELPDLLNKISNFADNGVICNSLEDLAKELTHDLEYSSEKTYWIKEAIENMNGMFELLMNIKKESLTYDAPVVDAELKEDIQQCLISDLFLYNVNHLSSLGITHIKQLTSMTELDLVKLEGVGRTRVAKIKSWLSKYGLRLKPISI